jgi:hypothetical protein
MNKFNEFIDKHYRKIFFFLLVVIFVNTCGNPNKSVNKRLDALTNQVDSLKNITVTGEELEIEGLKSEKRMIQATDRKMLDVQRQSEIEKTIDSLEKINK